MKGISVFKDPDQSTMQEEKRKLKTARTKGSLGHMRESQRFLSAWFLPVVLLEEVSVKVQRENRAWKIIYLVLFAGSAHTGLSETLRDGVATHVVRVVLWHVVELALEQFASSVFAFTLNFTNAWDSINDYLQH